MTKTPEQVRELTSDLGTSVWTLGAIGLLLESGLVAQLVEPRTLDDLTTRVGSLTRGQIAACLGVAAATGLVESDGSTHRLSEGARMFALPPMRTALSGDIRSNLMQALALLDSARTASPQPGWRHTDRALLQAQGDASTALPPMLKHHLLPNLGDFGDRLERPGARFLDIGVGVAALAIAMCRVFPEVGVVGVDTNEAPLAIARENAANAGLSERIEFRQMAAEALRDEAAFDLAWLPSFFIPNVDEVVRRIHAALKPGGYILMGADQANGTPRQLAVWQLIKEQWGGAKITPAAAETLLANAGFSEARTLPGPAWAPAMIVGRR